MPESLEEDNHFLTHRLVPMIIGFATKFIIKLIFNQITNTIWLLFPTQNNRISCLKKNLCRLCGPTSCLEQGELQNHTIF